MRLDRSLIIYVGWALGTNPTLRFAQQIYKTQQIYKKGWVLLRSTQPTANEDTTICNNQKLIKT